MIAAGMRITFALAAGLTLFTLAAAAGARQWRRQSAAHVRAPT